MYEDLLRAGSIRKVKVSFYEIQQAIKRAERDLKTAKIIMAEDWD